MHGQQNIKLDTCREYFHYPVVRVDALSMVAVSEVTNVVTTPVITASSPHCHPDIHHRRCPDSWSLPMWYRTRRTAATSVALSVFRPSLVVCYPDVCKPLHDILGYTCLAQWHGCVFTYVGCPESIQPF
jgi:hypothetical protein